MPFVTSSFLLLCVEHQAVSETPRHVQAANVGGAHLLSACHRDDCSKLQNLQNFRMVEFRVNKRYP